MLGRYARVRVHFEGVQRFRMASKSEIKLEILRQPPRLRGKPRSKIVRGCDDREGSADEIGVVLQAGFSPGGLEQSRIDARAHALRTRADELASLRQHVQRKRQPSRDDRIAR